MQIDSSATGIRAQVSNAAAALYPADPGADTAEALPAQQLQVLTQGGFGGANKNYLVSELDAADKLAGLAFLCLREGNVQKAHEYMQEATEIRKSVEPQLTGPQQQSLEKIMSLQADAFQNLQSDSWFTGVFGEIQAVFDLSEASEESQKLRNSILSGWETKALD